MIRYLKTEEKVIASGGKSNATYKKYAQSLKTAGAAMDFATIQAELLNVALNTGILLIASSAIEGAVNLFDSLITTTEEYNEKVEEARTAYNDTKSELQGVNDELAVQNKAIDDLLAKGKLSYTDENQLKDLKVTTQELLLQKDLLERQEAREKKDLAVSAADSVNSQYNLEKESEESINKYQEKLENNIDVSGHRGDLGNYVADADNISRIIAGYKEILKLKEQDKKKGNLESYNSLDIMANETEDSIESTLKELVTKKADMQDYYNSILEDISSGKDLNSNQKEIKSSYEEVSNAIKLIYTQLYPDKWNEMQISNLLSSDDIGITKKQLIDLAKQQNFAVDDIKGNYKNLDDAITNSDLLTDGISKTEEFVKIIKELASSEEAASDSANVFSEENSKAIDDYQTNIKTIQQALDSLSSGELDSSSIVDLMQQFSTFDWSAYGVDGSQSAQQLTTALKALAKQQYDTITATTGTNEVFEQMYQETIGVATETDSLSDAVNTYKTAVDALPEKLQDIKKMQDNVSTGYSYSDEQIENLKSKYPQLEDAISRTANGWSIEKSAIDDLYGSVINLDSEYQNAQSLMTRFLSSETAKRLEGYGLEIKTLEDLANFQAGDEMKAQEELGIGKQSLATMDPKLFADLQKYQSALNTIDDSKSKLKKIIDDSSSTSTSTSSGSTVTSGDTDSTSKFSEEIDWRERAIEKLTEKVDNLNNTLENTTSASKQKEKYQELIKTQTQLQTAYANTASSYHDSYTSYLSKLGSKSNYYKELIENGSTFKISDFSNVTTYNTVQNAKDMYDAWKKNAQAAKEAGYALKDYRNSLLNVDWEHAANSEETLTNSISSLQTKLDNTNSFSERAKILSKILEYQEKIIKNYEDAISDTKNNVDSYFSQLKKNLSKSELKDTNGGTLESGEKIKTTGLKGNDLKLAKDYNLYVAKYKKEIKELDNIRNEINSDIVDTKNLQFEDGLAKYENKIDSLENDKQDTQNKIDETEASGKKVSTQNYQKQIDINNQEIDTYKTLITLIKAKMTLSSKYSNEWTSLNDTLQSYQDTVSDLTQENYVLADSQKEVSSNIVDVKDAFDNLFNELDYYSNLIQDEDTYLTDGDGDFLGISDDGLTKLALLKTGLESAKASAANIKEQIGKLDKTNENYKDNLSDLTSQLYSALETEESYKNSIEETIDVIKDAEISSLEDKVDAYKDLINTQKDALTAEQELHDYENSISDANDEISSIESRISELQPAANSGDREALAEIADLEDDLAEKKEELDDLQYDHQMELAEDALDKSAELYEESINSQINDIENYYNKQKSLIDETANYTTAEMTAVLDNLYATAEKYGIKISNNLVNSISNSLAGNNVDLSNTTTDDGSLVSQDNSSLNTSEITNLLHNGKSSTGDSALNKYIKSKYNSYLTFSQMVELAQLLGLKEIDDVSDVQGNSKNRTKILNALKSAKFSTGGTVDASESMFSELAQLTGEDGIAFVKHNEEILTPEKAQLVNSLLNHIQPLYNLSDMLSNANASNISSINSNSSPIIQFNLNGGTISKDTISDFNKWKSEIVSEVGKVINNKIRVK